MIPNPPDPKNEGCTVARLKRWLASLPPEFDNAQIESITGPFPSVAKRLIAYRHKDEPAAVAIVVNSIGTHYSDDWAKYVEFVGILT